MHRQFQHQRHHHYNHWPWPEMEWKYFFFRLVLDWSWIVPPVDKTLFHPSLHFRRKKTFWHLKVWFDVGHSRSRCNSKEKTESVLEQSFKKSFSYHSCSLPDTLKGTKFIIVFLEENMMGTPRERLMSDCLVWDFDHRYFPYLVTEFFSPPELTFFALGFQIICKSCMSFLLYFLWTLPHLCLNIIYVFSSSEKGV